MQVQRLKNIIEKYYKALVSFAGGLLIILGVIDYFAKWGIIKFLLNFLTGIWSFVQFNFKLLVLLWLLVLTVFFLKKRVEKIVSPITDYNEISKLKNHLNTVVNPKLTNLTKGLEDLKKKVFDIERESLEKSFHRNKPGYIAESALVKLLEMDIDQGWFWRIHETLENVCNYLKKYSISSMTSADLTRQLNRLSSDEYTEIKKQIRNSIKIA